MVIGSVIAMQDATRKLAEGLRTLKLIFVGEEEQKTGGSVAHVSISRYWKSKHNDKDNDHENDKDDDFFLDDALQAMKYDPERNNDSDSESESSFSMFE